MHDVTKHVFFKRHFTMSHRGSRPLWIYSPAMPFPPHFHSHGTSSPHLHLHVTDCSFRQQTLPSEVGAAPQLRINIWMKRAVYEEIWTLLSKMIFSFSHLEWDKKTKQGSNEAGSNDLTPDWSEALPNFRDLSGFFVTSQKGWWLSEYFSKYIESEWKTL